MPADFKLIPVVLQRWAAKQATLIKGAFNAGGHHLHGGERWTPLKISTIEAKGGISTPLVSTGALRSSIFYRASGTVVALGSSSPIAVYHQNGTRGIPKRPIVVITRQDVERLKQDLKRTLESGEMVMRNQTTPKPAARAVDNSQLDA